MKTSIIFRCFKTVLGVTLALGLSTPGAAFAYDAPGDAANFYQSDKVTVQKVTFQNQYAMKVVGNLFIPKGLYKKNKNPAIVVGHPMGAVKEQSANLYATMMAERGFVTLSLDLSFWGPGRLSTGSGLGLSASAAAVVSSSARPRSIRA